MTDEELFGFIGQVARLMDSSCYFERTESSQPLYSRAILRSQV